MKGKQCEWLEHPWRQTQLDLHCLWPGFHTFWVFNAFRLSLFAFWILAFVFAPLHHDRHIFPRTVAAVLMLRRLETSLSVSLGFATILLKLSSRLIWGFPQTKSFEYEPQTNYCSNTWNTKRQRDWFLFYTDICIIHSNQACWDRRRWRPSHCLRLWCQVSQYVPLYLRYVRICQSICPLILELWCPFVSK